MKNNPTKENREEMLKLYEQQTEGNDDVHHEHIDWIYSDGDCCCCCDC